MIVLLLIFGFVLVAICGLISAKLKHDKRKKWWKPLVIGISIFVTILGLFIFLFWYLFCYLPFPPQD